MNSAILEIQVRIQARNALRDLQNLQSQLGRTAANINGMGAGSQVLNGMNRNVSAIQNAFLGATNAMKGFGNAFSTMGRHMSSFGKNLQWTGRQLEYTFTLPLALAGGFATKWALENEAAMTRVAKVYGDGSESAQQLRDELNALKTTFELLSNIYGVHQEQVIQIAEAWAQAGSAGAGLGKSVKTTLDFMILGGQGWEKSVEGLIAVQATYGLSTAELTDQIAILNAIENQTGASMSDLVTVIQKAGGAARFAGIDIRHLSAFAAALIPATGSASTAGDALKTTISRLMAPTKDVTEALGFLGINVLDAGWQSLNAAQRMEKMAGAFDQVTPAQQALLASVIAGRRQFNKLEVAMDAVGNKTSYYNKALEATADQQKANAQYTKELSVFLSSQPQAFKVMTTSLQNMMARAIVPLLPLLAQFLNYVVRIVKAFTELEPETQQFILMGLLILALIGPLARLTGGFILLGGTATSVIGFIIKAIAGIPAAIGFVISFFGYAWTYIAVGALEAASAISAAWTALGGAISTAWIGVRLFFMALWPAIVSGATAAWEYLTIIAGPSAVAAIQGAWASLVAFFSAIWGGIVGAVSAAVGAISWPVVAVVAAVLAVIAGLLYAFNEDVRAWVNNLVSTVWGMFQELPVMVRVIIGMMVGPLVLIADAVQNMAAVIIQTFAGLFPTIYADLVSLVKGFMGALQNIARGLSQLPGVVARVFTNIVRIVAQAIRIVVEWLSYLNPFARHSPSLVDNVTAGVDEILNQYGRLNNIDSVLAGAKKAHQDFLSSVGQGDEVSKMRAAHADDRKVVAEANPGALGSFDALVTQIGMLKNLLPGLQAQMDAQEAVVKQWDAALKNANRALEEQERILENYKNALQEIEQQLADAKEVLNDLAKTGITGMRGMEDAIFDNEMAQKRLQLEMMDWEDMNGPIEDTRDLLANLAGDIEGLRATREDLRLSGAGSDILGGIDEQIKALEDAQGSLSSTGSPFEEMQKELDNLKRSGERLELEKSINFDPQLRQIDQLANGLEELPFDEIIRRMTEQKALIAELEAKQRDANQAVKDQELIVDALKMKRDQIADTLDLEREKLDAIKDVYNSINDAIQDMEASLNGVASALKDALEEAKKLKGDGVGLDDLFGAAGAGDFDIPGGAGAGIGREGGLEDINKLNEELQKQFDEMLAGMGGLDPFKPLKDAWNTTTQWFKDRWKSLTDWLSSTWESFTSTISDKWQSWVAGPLYTAWETVKGWWTSLMTFLGEAWNSYGKPVIDFFVMVWSSYVQPALQAFADFFVMIWNTVIYPVIAWIWNSVFKPFFDWIVNFINSYVIPVFQLFQVVAEIVFRVIAGVAIWLWNQLDDVFGFIMDAIRVVGDFFVMLYNNYVKPAFDWIVNAINWAWNNVIRPTFDAIGWALGVLGNFFVRLYNDYVRPAFDWISNAISWAWNVAIRPIFDAFGDGIRRLGDVFFWLRDHVVDPVMGTIQGIIRNAWNGIAGGLESLINGAIGGFNKLAGVVNGVAGAIGVTNRVNEMPQVQIPRMASGGLIPASRVDAGFLVDQARAIVGEGRKGYPEYVIPTDPRYRGNALHLLSMLAADLSVVPKLAAGGMLAGRSAVSASVGRPTVTNITSNKTVYFSGDLSFPNITSPNDAREFIDNLSSLVD